jgi:hypothetical protein
MAMSKNAQSAIIVLVLGLGFFGLIGYWASRPSEPAKPQASAAQTAIPEKQGTYDKYKYWVGTKDGVNAALFDPFLPHDDTVLVGAIKSIATTAYGSDVIGSAQPTVESCADGNCIVFRTDSGSYAFFPVKEDTGEIHSIKFYKN